MIPARQKLGAGLCGIGYYVSGQADPEFACQPGSDVGGPALTDASLDRTPGKCYAVLTNGDGNHLRIAVSVFTEKSEHRPLVRDS